MREGSHPYQAQPRRVAYALQGPLKEGLGSVQKQKMLVSLDIDETLEWCKSFMLVSEANGNVKLYLDLACLNNPD